MIRLVGLLMVIASCGTICPNDTHATRPAISGTYFAGPDRATCINAPVTPAADAEQHQLTPSPDKRTVVETFLRNGKAYAITYDVTSIDWATL